uniref:Uncharacterized protein n=1 Tax=Populus trichocarpa x Populus deltoides TaxID=3695 RepID=A9PJ03_9ROSI|nr:unknown [Populus trichocarpa x Populus deltoides]
MVLNSWKVLQLPMKSVLFWSLLVSMLSKVDRFLILEYLKALLVHSKFAMSKFLEDLLFILVLLLESVADFLWMKKLPARLTMIGVSSLLPIIPVRTC